MGHDQLISFVNKTRFCHSHFYHDDIKKIILGRGGGGGEGEVKA